MRSAVFRVPYGNKILIQAYSQGGFLFAYVVQWVRGGVYALAEESVNSKSELIAATSHFRKHFPLQDECDDSRAVGLREEVRRLC